MAKCNYVIVCGLKRRICRRANGTTMSNVVVAAGKKTAGRKSKSARKATRKPGKKSKARKASRGMVAPRNRARADAGPSWLNPNAHTLNMKCVKRKVGGKCRRQCTIDGKLVINDAAKGCRAKAIVQKAAR